MTDPNNILAAPSGPPPTNTTPTADQRVAALEARLAQLEPLAQRGAAAAAADRLALDAQVSRLSQADQETVARLSESDRAAVTARLLASPGAFRAPPVIGGGPPVPAGAPLDVGAEIARGVPVRMIKEAHPEAFQKYLASIAPPPKATTQYSQMLALSREKQLAAAARGHRR